jgi:succinylglutamate desuccinylase
MIEIHHKSLNKSLSVSRVIKEIKGKPNGPVAVFFGGIHGNETAGVFALNSVLNKLDKDLVNGNIYGISGNLKALQRNERFIDSDLNRIWLHKNLKTLQNGKILSPEEEEQKELYLLLENILNAHSGPFYFIDLHTTSSKTLPFITINDSMVNRRFSQLFPVPIVLGIEEYLNGPLLSYINTLGYVSLGFESGQHDDEHAITCAIAFIYLVLGFTELVDRKKIENFEVYYNLLKMESLANTNVFEIVYLHTISEGERFKMMPNLNSFQNIKKGTLLAKSNDTDLFAERDSVLFMPLYQEIGTDGYFIIRKIKPIFLKLSNFLRRIKADALLILLPGISWHTPEKYALKVNLKIARFLAKPLFHLLGYRNRKIDKTHLIIFNRERASKLKSYLHTRWYKNGIN